MCSKTFVVCLVITCCPEWCQSLQAGQCLDQVAEVEQAAVAVLAAQAGVRWLRRRGCAGRSMRPKEKGLFRSLGNLQPTAEEPFFFMPLGR